MRALAEFIMRGRAQACLVALAGNLVPLVSPSAVAMVTMRRSLADGCLVLLWACLPLLVTGYFSDANTLIVASSLAAVVAVWLCADVLKKSASWEAAIIASLLLSSVAMVMVSIFLQLPTEALVKEVQQVLVVLREQTTTDPTSVFYLLMGVTALGLGLEDISNNFVIGFLSWLTTLSVIGSLLLARWWQSILYNPGGFQKEFHSLRFDKTWAAVLLLAILASNVGPADYAVWGSLLGVPLLLSGLGLVHYTAGFLHLKTHWLFLVYVGLVLFGPLTIVLIGIGFLDSFLDLRIRLKGKKSP